MGRPRIILFPTPMLRKKIGMMNKLFGLWENSKVVDDVQKKANPQPVMKDGVPDFLSQSRGFGSKYVTRRQIVLNRHLTEILSDILATDYDKTLRDLGVKITSIETKAWNKGVSVFYSTDRPYDETLHKKLNAINSQLIYGVAERRLIGRMPHVNFVYDKTIAIDRILDEALSKCSEKTEVDNQLVKTTNDQLYISKDLGSQEPKLISKRFSAPVDMDNTMLGLNYPELYDKVASKLERGRGESSRAISNTSLFPAAKPLFRAPREDQDIEDPTTRILRMKKFLVSQKKKSEHLARVRRKSEILAQDSFKWSQPEEAEDELQDDLHESQDNSS